MPGQPKGSNPTSSTIGSKSATSGKATNTGGGATRSGASGMSASKGNASSGKSSAKPGGSGVTGSKGGGANTQKPGAGGNAGKVTTGNLRQAQSNLANNRNTALGKISTAANKNASNAGSGAVGAGRGLTAGSPLGKTYVSSSATPQMQRMGAISRGPGVLNSPRAENIARTTAFGESPSGLRAPGLASALRTSALNNQSLFSARGATPAQQALLNKIGSSALHVAMTTGLDPRTVLGQALTESTTARHPSKVSALARNANNLFGIKGTGQPNEYWSGDISNMPTKEVYNGKTVTVNEPFRSYATPNQSVLDYGNLISRRYSSAADNPTPEGQLRAIRGGGYATHPSESYVQMGVRNADRLSTGGTSLAGTQLASGAFPSNQIAGPASAAADAARIQRRDDALKTLSSPLQQAPSLGAWQGPRQQNDPTAPRAIPSPQSMQMVSPVQRPNMRPLQSFISGDPRAAMTPGAFPQARMQSPVMSDPRVGLPTGAFPAARMQSPVMGDPRANMNPGSYPAAPKAPTMGTDARVGLPVGAYPAARMQSPVMSDPRASMKPGSFPAAKPASVFADPRVGLPTGAYPQAKPISIVSDPRASMRPGSYPAMMKDQARVPATEGFVQSGWVKDQSRLPQTLPGAIDPRVSMQPGTYPAAPPQPMQTAWNVPPMGGALPADIGTALGVWSTNRVPPAAPHEGTIHSQTAENAPSFWQQGGDLFNKASTAVTDQLDANKQKVAEIEKKVGKLTPEKVKMWAWWNGLGGGTTAKASPTDPGPGSKQYRPPGQFAGGGGGYGGGGGGGGSPSSGGEAGSPAEYLAGLRHIMVAQNAPAEDIAYIDQLLSQTGA